MSMLLAVIIIVDKPIEESIGSRCRLAVVY